MAGLDTAIHAFSVVPRLLKLGVDRPIKSGDDEFYASKPMTLGMTTDS
jgi:hypothetical protein